MSPVCGADGDGAERTDRVAMLSAVPFLDAQTLNKSQGSMGCSGGRVVSARECVLRTHAVPARRIMIATARLRFPEGVQGSW